MPLPLSLNTVIARCRFLLCLCWYLLLCGHSSWATASKTHHPGLFDLWWDEAHGQVHMAIPEFHKDYLYIVSLPHGVGSNDIGLDRGQLGRELVVQFKPAGDKVLMVAQNLSYRANSANPAERRAVTEAFATSVLASFKWVDGNRDRRAVDITPLLLSDAYGVKSTLANRNQGSFSLSRELSAAAPDGIRSFAENALAEAWLTYESQDPGSEVISVTPEPTKVTVKVRHHFIQLPEQPLARRAFHPQSGYFSLPYRDYAAALDEPIEQHLLVRHRLEKQDPQAELSPALEPLIYYVDSGAPEPIRTALMEGAAWWNDAFNAAGFIDAFQVKVLPPDADPLDVRYNMIQWVHRSTRGWSYGGSIVDPRSGEILKGHVSLGSLRVRQDMLIANALTSPFGPEGDQGDAAQAMALARLRQLSAHEVGHTLGLAHNFFTSAAEDASVMDYPHPNLALNKDGSIDLSGAYATGIGEWDKLAIVYGYGQGEVSDKTRLAAHLTQAEQMGLRFITDADVRGPATAHAGAHLWDNGSDAVAQFTKLLAIRAAGIQQFSRFALRPQQPLSDLETALVPLYLLHRYQAEAVAKQIAGVDYDYALNTAPHSVKRVPPARQKAALQALIDSLHPNQLRLPQPLLAQLVPPAFGHQRSRENFRHRTANSFDALAPARTASQLIVDMILEPKRAQRLWQQSLAETGQLDLNGTLASLSEQLILPLLAAEQSDLISTETAWVTLRAMQRLAQSETISDPVRAQVTAELRRLASALAAKPAGAVMSADIDRFLRNPEQANLPAPEVIPPGSPI